MNQKNAIDFAKKYLEDILSFFGLNTDVSAHQDEDVIELNVPSTRLNGFLIGQRGDTLRSLQYLVSNALRNQNFDVTRVNIDIADYKQHRADRLAEKAKEWAQSVRDNKETKHLRPMNPADRRIVHQTISEEPDVVSESEGEGRERHIVLKPE
jgi:spoIIIJ-associated protein